MQIPIDEIRIDKEIQLKNRSTSEGIVATYVEVLSNDGALPGVTVFHDGDAYWLSDGFHRVSAYRFLGRRKVPAEIRTGSRQDAMIHAAIANVTHGRPMSQSEKREAGLRLLELTDWSQARIARELAVTQQSVSNWASHKNLYDRPVTVERGGQTYEMNTTNIGGPKESKAQRGNQHSLEERQDFYNRWRQDNRDLGLDDFGEPANEESTQEQQGIGIHASSESDEWYTPQHIIERTLAVLGEIDLDPCSNSLEFPNVPAHRHLTIQEDGLAHPWYGRIYMNPPYGREIAEWIDHLYEQYQRGNVDEAIALVPARTDTQWFQVLREFPRCFIHGRLKFSGNDNSAPFPSTAIYLGDNLSQFLHAFNDIGDIYELIEG